MSNDELHNEAGFSDEIRKLLLSAKEEDFLVPANFFEEQEKEMSLKALHGVEDFKVPDGYFEESTELIIAAESIDDRPMSTFFDEQHEQIMRQLKIESLREENEFNVPEGYFEQQEEALVKKVIPHAPAKVINMRSRSLWFVAAAACAVFAVFYFLPDKNQEQESFAELIQKTDLEIDDLEYFASEEDYYELYIEIEESLDADTIINDTLTVKEFQENEILPSTNEPVKLDPRTGLPIKKNKNGVKPLGDEDIPTWDDITDQELLDYLLEEGDDDLLKDL